VGKDNKIGLKMLFLYLIAILFKDLIATVGRARIEEQKQTALQNIQKSKNETLKQLDIQYASADKAKQSFGYIAISFLSCLFGCIFLNDFMKLCIYYLGECRMNSSRNMYEIEEDRDEVILEMDKIYAEELDDSLEKVYFKLVKANANNKKT